MDNIVLNGPNGSSINIGSFLLYDPGADFGEQDLLKAAYAENPAAEGAVLAFETVNHRSMQFPLRLASTSAFSGVNGLQAWLRTLARPGATLDVQLEGVASSEAVRFDVLTGRLEADYEPRQYAQLDRLPATLKLDTQPFGYWPTMILLASAASIGGPGVLSLNLGGSIFGDVPGLAQLFIAPTTATGFGGGAGVQKTDLALWSFGARPSFQAFWPAASGLAIASATNEAASLIGDAFAPASQAIRYFLASSAGIKNPFFTNGWQKMAEWIVPPPLEPAYRGKFRAFTYARLGPSQTHAVQAALDVAGPTIAAPPALGSAAPIASLPPAIASSGGVGGASPAYCFLDLGELSLPAFASYAGDLQFRLWMSGATNDPGLTATGLLDVAGLYLLPLDGAAGIMASGLSNPGRFFADAVLGDFLITSASSVIGSIGAISRAGAYRGLRPVVGASTIQLDLNLAGRGNMAVPTNHPAIRSEPHFAGPVSVSYRPRFAFMKGI